MKKLLIILLVLNGLESFSQTKPFYQIKAESEKYFDEKLNRKAKLDAEGLKQINKDHEMRCYNRWAYWAERHLDTQGFVNQEFDYNKTAIDILEKQNKNAKPDGDLSIGGNWSNLPIANYTSNGGIQGGIGRVSCIVEIPGTFDVLIGTAGGGIWRGYKLQNGYNWVCLSDNIPQLGVADIAINPANTNEIVIATGSGYGGGGSSGGTSIGILKSWDGGNNWHKTAFAFTSNQNLNIFKIAVDPTNFQNMILATNGGLYRTDDGFATEPFSVPNTLNGNTSTGGIWYDIKYKPGDNTTLYASSISGVWRSTNSGVSFTNIFLVPAPATTVSQRVMLGVSNNNPELIYAISGNNGKNVGAAGNMPNSNIGFVGFYRSTDGGNNFTTRSTTPNILGNNANGSMGSYATADYALAMDVSPTDQNRIIVGSLNTWESVDGGLNWINRSDNGAQFGSQAYVHADIHFLKYNAFGNVFAGTDGGYFHMLAGNNFWTFESMGVNVTQFYKINIGNQINLLGYSGRVIYGGSQDNGQHRWQVGSFTKVVGGDGMDNAITSPIGASAVACIQNGGLNYSGNYGATFNTPAFPPAENGLGHWVTPIVRHSNVAEIVYAGYKNYYASYDGGLNWLGLVITGFPNVIHAMGQGVFSTIGQPNTNVVYCATDINTNSMAGPNYKLYRFENDNAATKTDITGPFNSNFITSIAVDPTNARYVFVTLSGYDAPNKVFFSSDKGSTWTNITSNLPNIPVHCIALKDGGGTGIYIGSDIGVFHRFSFGGAEKWTLFSNKLPNVAVNDIELDIPNNELFAATYGRGLWKTDLYTICSTNLTHNEWSVGQEYYEVSNTINSTAVITGGFGSKVTYNAGQEIVFGEGFTITDGSAMNAYIAGCGQVRPDEQFLRKSAENEPAAPVIQPIINVKNKAKKQ